MNNYPLISVIVPIYKVEKYLSKCVDSILGQTYENLEIILVDDGSPDNCPSMCDSYCETDKRIKVIHKSNGGLSDARNVGLDYAKGEMIVFVDSDDYIDANMIKNMYDAMNETNSDLVICDYSFVDENGLVEYKPNIFETEIIEKLEALNRIYEAKGTCYIVTWNKLYRKEIFDDLRFDKGKIHEDEFIIHKVFSKCNKIVTISTPYYYYLQRGDSIMGKKYNVKRMDYIEALCNRYNFFLDVNYRELKDKTFNRLLDAFAEVKSNFKPQLKSDRIRVKEIEEMVNKVYFSSNKTLKQQIIYHFPKLYIYAYNKYSERMKSQ